MCVKLVILFPFHKMKQRNEPQTLYQCSFFMLEKCPQIITKIFLVTLKMKSLFIHMNIFHTGWYIHVVSSQKFKFLLKQEKPLIYHRHSYGVKMKFTPPPPNNSFLYVRIHLLLTLPLTNVTLFDTNKP